VDDGKKGNEGEKEEEDAPISKVRSYIKAKPDEGDEDDKDEEENGNGMLNLKILSMK
jgi:hypothetical protein